MDFEAREKRKYIRNALLSFVCTAVCIGIDIRSFWRHGGFYMTWQLAVSFVLYVILNFMGIRAVKKARELSKKSGE